MSRRALVGGVRIWRAFRIALPASCLSLAFCLIVGGAAAATAHTAKRPNDRGSAHLAPKRAAPHPFALIASSFGMQVAYGVGGHPNGVAVADFNGDGIPDLATANGNDNDVSVLLGNGDGTFQAQVAYPAGGNPTSIAVADFNGDGHPDIAVANQTDNNVSVLLGNGDGTFRPQTPARTGAAPDSIAVGDMNGDGVPDIAVGYNGSVQESVLLGNGDGSFRLPAGGGSHSSIIPYGVNIADVNRDGKMDLVVNDTSGHIQVLLGNGDGTFGGGHLTSIGGGVVGDTASVSLADLNADGLPDLVAPLTSVGFVTPLTGNGDSSFHVVGTPPQVGNSPVASAEADFDGDGHPDSAVVNNADGTVSVLPGAGDGSLSAGPTLGVGSGPDSVAVGDFNNDGRPDIVVANGNDNTVSVLINQVGGFGSAEIHPSTTGVHSVLIDQLRLTGPSGPGDQSVDLYNAAAAPVSIGGWELEGSNGGFSTIPWGTVLAVHGHLLMAGPGAGGYSLSGYAAGNAELPTGPLLEPATGGFRLVATDGAVIDAVGFAGAPAGFATGAGIPFPAALPPATDQYGWLRKFSAGSPVNTNDNASDFEFVSTGDNDAAHGSPVLGAPDAPGLQSTVNRNGALQSSLLDPTVSATSSPNRIFQAGVGGAPGTLIINRRIINCTGSSSGPCVNTSPSDTLANTIVLHLRITDLTTLGSAGAGPGQAVLEAVSSPGGTFGGVTVAGLTLQQPPNQPNGGGVNSTWDASVNLPSTGLLPGSSISVEFEFKVLQGGRFKFAYNAEAPAGLA